MVRGRKVHGRDKGEEAHRKGKLACERWKRGEKGVCERGKKGIGVQKRGKGSMKERKGV